MITVTSLPKNQAPEALRMQFEALASDPSFKLSRSRRGTYVNPAVARDWKWFRLGAATVAEMRPATPAAEAAELVAMTQSLARPYPSPPEGAGWRQGVEAAAALLSKKADDFAREHGYDDLGGLSFGRGAHADAKLDYHSSLIEIAEELRAMSPAPPASEAKERGNG